ncbi:unnamed protein product [Moneuplotes crassus]|uniref:Hexose transporter 1 n=1 Tax=Euplotes crassus TaxID=5936 RepID=A0AAD1UCY6_EUPCR|nr:unnamed protein product [Moneuplotes crassus]
MTRAYQTYILGRAIMGLSFGISNAIAPMFIMELSPPKMRGILISFVTLWINIGLLIPILLNFALPVFIRPFSIVPDYCGPLVGKHIIWREIFMVPIIFATIKLLCLLFIFKKENPIYEEYLISKSDSYDTSGDFEVEESALEGEFSTNIQQAQSKPPTKLEKDTWSALCRRRGKRKLMAGVTVRLIAQLSGIAIVLNFAFTLRINPNSTHGNLRLMITILSIVLIPASMLLLTYCKRRTLLLTGSLISCLCLTVLFQTSLEVNYTNFGVPMFNGFPNILSTVFVLIFATNFWVTKGATLYVYCGEILTDKGMAIATATHWFFNAVVIILPSMAFRLADMANFAIWFHESNAIFFFIFGGICMMSFFITIIALKETFGKTHYQISNGFGKTNYHSLATIHH